MPQLSETPKGLLSCKLCTSAGVTSETELTGFSCLSGFQNYVEKVSY